MTSPHSGITVSGRTVRSIVESVRSFTVLVDAILQVMRIETRDDSGGRAIDPSTWYPIEDYLLAYRKIDSLLGGRGLEKIGTLIPQHAILPPDITSAHALLSALDVTYHMNHARDGKPMFDPATGTMLEGIGHYGYRRVGEREVQMECANPYPCRFDLGLVRGMARRFEPDAVVEHHPDGGCRTRGDDRCSYVVRW